MAGDLPEDLVLVDVQSMQSMLHGFCLHDPDTPYTRLPVAFAKETNYMGGLDTAGGRIRFSTDSKYVAIKVVMPCVQRFCHMTLCASSGFDMYIDQGDNSTYYATYYPPIDMKDGYEAIIHFPEKKTRYLTLNFPLYNRVSAFYLGLQQDALIDSGAPYKSCKPFVYYGSSITQGGCASRPGNAYPAIISRKLNIDYLNLGFSGRARGEQAMAEYIAQLNMGIFIMDYDYNAPDELHLRQTHESFFQIIRAKNPILPILMISRPNFDSTPQYLDPSLHAATMRRDIVYQTYLRAVKQGDQRVYYLDGQSLFGGEGRDSCTVDATHPNDMGFWRMADVIGQTLKFILNDI